MLASSVSGSTAGYGEACRWLQRLCPRPAPQGLEAVRLSLAAEAEPALVSSLAGLEEEAEAEAARRVAVELLASSSGGRCAFCGKKAEAAAEVWDYRLEGGGGPRGLGVAVLERVVPACARCLEALKASIEAVRGRDKRLVKHLSKVNKVKKNVVKEALEKIARLHKLLSEAESWSVRLDALRGAPPRGRRALEIFLEMIASGEIAVDSGRVYAEVLDSEEVRATVEESVERLCSSPTLASSLAHLASEEGLAPSWAALEELVERLRPRVCSGRYIPARLVPLLRGAWMLRLPPRVGARLFAALVSRVNSPREPSWVHRVETSLRRPAIVWVYSPSSLDPGIVARVLREALELLPPGVEPVEPPVYRHGGPGGPVLYRAQPTTTRL